MMNRQIFILALDGVPYTLLNQLSDSGIMPNLRRLIERGFFMQMDSVYPPVSSVAWASFMTGSQPGAHGVYGFVDRDPQSLDWFVPLSDRLNGKTLWEILSERQKRVFVMNVPMTYPPRKVNGISICGFLGSDIIKGTFPPEIGYLLKSRGYRIDVNTELAKSDLAAFYDDLNSVLEKRIETMWYFWKREPWDFFMTHIMETDRLHHFFWQRFENKIQPYHDMFLQFYRRIDQLIGRISDTIPEEMGLLLLSDHGFTTLKKEMYLNRWLVDKGYLVYKNTSPVSLKDMDESSIAYSLYPGRIYLSIKGRELFGRVSSEIEYETIRREISRDIMNLKDPDSGEPVINSVFNGEEVFTGSGISHLQRRSFNELQNQKFPDLLIIANNGYDLKGSLTSDSLFKKQHFNGMHTFNDAFLLGKNVQSPKKRISIDRVSALILDYLGFGHPVSA